MAPASLSSLRLCNEPDVRHIITSLPVKSCSLASPTQGRLPDSQKHATILPLLKKSGPDSADMAKFCPVSNRSFLSKVTEKVLTRQLNVYLTKHDLLPWYQSAYRNHHSTKTTMLRVLPDTLTAADNRQVMLLAMLNLSAAFDSGSFTFATTVAAVFWSKWCCITMDDTVLEWS